MENDDWKILLPNIGTGLLCAGIPMMVMENYKYFFSGLVTTIIGFLLIVCAKFIKSNAQIFWDYINKANKFAKEKSEIEVFDSESGLDHGTFSNFAFDLMNAMPCFYKIERDNQLKDEIVAMGEPFKESSLFDIEGEAKKVKKAYQVLCIFLGTFYEIKDHSVHHSQNFKPSELKRYQRFLD